MAQSDMSQRSFLVRAQVLGSEFWYLEVLSSLGALWLKLQPHTASPLRSVLQGPVRYGTVLSSERSTRQHGVSLDVT